MQENSENTATTASLTDRFLDAVETPRGRAITYTSTILTLAGMIAAVGNGAAGPAAAFGAMLIAPLYVSGCLLDKLNLKKFFCIRSNLNGIARISIAFSALCGFAGYAVQSANESEAKNKQESARIAALPEMSPDTPVTVTAKQAYCGAKTGWINPPGTQKKLNCN